jgi:hypothetical protein
MIELWVQSFNDNTCIFNVPYCAANDFGMQSRNVIGRIQIIAPRHRPNRRFRRIADCRYFVSDLGTAQHYSHCRERHGAKEFTPTPSRAKRMQTCTPSRTEIKFCNRYRGTPQFPAVHYCLQKICGYGTAGEPQHVVLPRYPAVPLTAGPRVIH